MKATLFFLLISLSASAQLTQVVNGVVVPVSSSDSAAFVQEWQANKEAASLDSLNNSKVVNYIKSVAQSAVGVRVQDLTTAQRNALTLILFRNAGALEIRNDSILIKQLNTWARTAE